MRFIDRLRRPDWLGELHAALIAALVLTGAVVAANLGALTVGAPVSVEVPADAVTGVDGLAQGAAVDPEGTVPVLVDHPSTTQLVTAALTSLPTLLVVTALLALLLGVVRRARRGGPFDAHVITRLRQIAVVALVGGVLARLVEIIAGMELTSTVREDTLSTTFQAQSILGWVLIGFALLAVAEVVKRGLVLRTELDAVI